MYQLQRGKKKRMWSSELPDGSGNNKSEDRIIIGSELCVIPYHSLHITTIE